MADDTLLRAERVSKKYCKLLRRSMAYGISDIARNMLGMRAASERLRPGEFWAVDDVSFELSRGGSLGVIGPNGSGKSTLLKMINGIFWPDRGRISVRGRVGALIEVGAGFHPLLNGRENIYVNAAILGMTRREVKAKFDRIVEFADIGEFLEAPVKHYSSGMHVRLGFAIAVHCDPDVLLVDEILAVGDVAFQAKCFNTIGELRKQGVAIMMVSHNPHNISRFCERSLYLRRGACQYQGDSEQALGLYVRDTLTAQKQRLVSEPGAQAMGSGRIRIIRIAFLDGEAREVDRIETGQALTLRVHYERAEQAPDDVELDVVIKDSDGVLFQGTNTGHGQRLRALGRRGTLDVRFRSMPVNNRMLSFYCALWNADRTELLDWKRELELRVLGKANSIGGLLLECEWLSVVEQD